jgi:ABC-type nitrate/sulfonate/bicarbonate transport system permease component
MTVAERQETTDAPGALLSRLKTTLAFLDPLRIVGVILFIAIWQLLTLRLPAIILPTPFGVLARLFSDFLSAPALSYYGVSEANLYGNLIYTAENVAVAVIAGSAIGILSGLLSAEAV